jgi:hypothetical protein
LSATKTGGWTSDEVEVVSESSMTNGVSGMESGHLPTDQSYLTANSEGSIGPVRTERLRGQCASRGRKGKGKEVRKGTPPMPSTTQVGEL